MIIDILASAQAVMLTNEPQIKYLSCQKVLVKTFCLILGVMKEIILTCFCFRAGSG